MRYAILLFVASLLCWPALAGDATAPPSAAIGVDAIKAAAERISAAEKEIADGEAALRALRDAAAAALVGDPIESSNVSADKNPSSKLPNSQASLVGSPDAAGGNPPTVPADPPAAPLHAEIVASTTEATAGQFVLLDGSKATGGPVKWRLIPECPSMTGENGLKLAFAAAPPQTVIQVVGNGTDFDVAVVMIEEAGPPDPPVPPTPPTPPVPPTPTAVKLFVVFWRDEATTTPAAHAILNDKGLRDAITEAGNELRSFDVNGTADEISGLKPQLDKLGSLPAVTVQDAATGKVLGAFTLPSTPDLVLSEVRKYQMK